MLTLPRTLSLTPAQFAEVCAANPEAVLELDADGTLIEMPPTGGSTSTRNTRLLMRLQLWADRQGGWKVFDSSGGFLLPDGSVRSPDASLVRLERWQALSEAERDGFPPLCPDLVVELASPSDQPEALRLKMAAYISNGAQLGWLLLPRQHTVEVWSTDSTTRAARFSALNDASRLEAAEEFPGLVVDLEEIWAG
jgi:Uma2 family endonuclease